MLVPWRVNLLNNLEISSCMFLHYGKKSHVVVNTNVTLDFLCFTWSNWNGLGFGTLGPRYQEFIHFESIPQYHFLSKKNQYPFPDVNFLGKHWWTKWGNIFAEHLTCSMLPRIISSMPMPHVYPNHLKCPKAEVNFIARPWEYAIKAFVHRLRT